MGITPELIEQINVLARKKKDGTITEAELKEQEKLRKEYIEGFRQNMRATMSTVDIVDEIQISDDKQKFEDIESKLKDVDGVVGVVNKDGNTTIAYLEKDITKDKILELLGE